MYKKLIQAGALATAVVLAAPAAAEDGTVVARINGEAITEAEIEAMVRQSNRGQNMELTPSQRQQVVDRMIEVTLLAQKAKEQGIADDPAIQAQIETTRRLVLARSLVQDISQSSEAITEEAIQAAYDERYGAEDANLELKARHILLPSKKKAQAMIEQLNQGADFAKLASENSQGPTKKRGGNLGWFAADEMVPVFSDAAKQLEEGEYTKEPVQTRFGWHVIKLEGKRTPEPPPLDEVRQQIRRELTSNRITDRIKAMREEATIEINEEWQQASSGNGGNAGSGAAEGDGQ